MLGNSQSTVEESFVDGTLEYPQYTRPSTIREMDVPQVLLSGDHERVARWRRRQALLRTRERRPDLFEKLNLTDLDKALLDEDDENSGSR